METRREKESRKAEIEDQQFSVIDAKAHHFTKRQIVGRNQGGTGGIVWINEKDRVETTSALDQPVVDRSRFGEQRFVQWRHRHLHVFHQIVKIVEAGLDETDPKIPLPKVGGGDMHRDGRRVDEKDFVSPLEGA